MGLLDHPASSIGGGRKVVTTAGTAVPLISTVASTNWVIVQAETDNTGKIAVGDSGVLAALTSQTRGVVLSAGESVTLPLSDLRQVYIDSTVNGDGVTYLYGAS